MSGAGDDADVLVVGAGLAGLACALELRRHEIAVRVLEAGDGVGGRVRTDAVAGFRLDRGFQILLVSYPEAQRLLDLDRLELRRFQPGALVHLGNRFHRVADPFRQPGSALATLRAPVGTLLDKARIARLRLRLLRAEPASLLRAPETSTHERLAALGFSSTIVERLFRPWFGGVLLDPQLTTSSRMFEILFRAFASGDAAVPAHGMGAIGDQLAARLPQGLVELDTRVTGVSSGEVRTADGRRLQARAVVVATDGSAAARLTGVRDPGSRSSATVWFAADRAPIDEPVLLLDGDRSGPALNAVVMSAVSADYAPPGAALVAASAPGASGDGLEVAVREQLRRWFGPTVSAWRHLRTDVIDHALPDQSPPFTPKRRVRLGSGVYVCGDHRDTGSIQGALYSGRRTADAVREQLAVSS